ncbi:MAG: hypothetical protein Q4C70_14385 [Planctomycetia bacterium]|nr:hypothetical protein [Planctomycetia bacterium]
MEENPRNQFSADTQNTENAMPNLLPGFSQEQILERERKIDGWINFVVFAVVLLALVPIFRWGNHIFRTQSTDHFLIGLPLSDLNALQPVIGETPPPKTAEYMNRSFMIVLWGPWDDISCDLLQKISIPLQAAQKNKNFRVIPIVYFTRTAEPIPWYEMDREQRQQFIEQKRMEEMRLSQYVQQSFRGHGFFFPNVWWDPADRFRLDMINMAIEESKTLRRKVDGLGFPTVIYAENGVIRNVWSSNSEQDIQEISETLKIIATQ